MNCSKCGRLMTYIDEYNTHHYHAFCPACEPKVLPKLEKFCGSWIGKTKDEYKMEDYLDTLRVHILWLEKRVKKLEEV